MRTNANPPIRGRFCSLSKSPPPPRQAPVAVGGIFDILGLMHRSTVLTTIFRRLFQGVGCICCCLFVFWTVTMADAAMQQPKASASPKKALQPRVDSYTLTQRGDGYRVSISYPQTGNAVADAELAIWAREQAAVFTKAVSLIPTPPPVPYNLSISYETVPSPSQIISVVFFINTAMGGAHPEPGMATFVYNRRDGRRLSYGDLFRNQDGLVQAFSDICHKGLLEQLGSRAIMDMLKAGTAQDMANFDLFALVKEGIRIYFPPYQAAPYNEGYLSVTIPLGDLQNLDPHVALWDNP